jgi:two-component system, NarL family, response regulator YdfI
MRVAVAIVATSPQERARLETGLRSSPRLRLVASAPRLPLPLGHEPVDVVVLAVSAAALPAAIEALARLAKVRATVVLADRRSSVRDWLTAGVGAVLPSDASDTEIIAAVEAAAAGLVVVRRDAAIALTSGLVGESRPLAREVETLTPREREVLGMLAEGFGNRAIATRLGISEHTAKFHVASILGKLGATTRTEAVTLGIRFGLLVV